MFTCFIRYRIEPDKSDEFRELAHGLRWLGNMEELITAILFPERTRTICRARLSVFPVCGPSEAPPMQEADNIRDMRLQRDLGIYQVSAFTQASQSRPDHSITSGSKGSRNIAPTPAAEPCTGDQYEN
jgi:hypothetical protein